MSNFFFLFNIVLALIVVFYERKNPSSTWAWIMVLFFLPIIGFFLYFFFGRSFRKKNLKKQSAYQNGELTAFSDRQRQAILDGTYSYPDSVPEKLKGLVRMNVATSLSPLTDNNKLSIFTDGKEKFKALFDDIRQAKDHIHLEYYIYRKDSFGQELIDLLTEKASAGVKVLLLYDDVGSDSLKGDFLEAFIEAGGKAQAFMPSKLPVLNSNMNYRNHRKIAVIDGTVAYTGGFNVGDEYLGKKPAFGFWRDTHLRITGGAVHTLQHRFLLDWNEASATHPVKYADTYFPVAPDRDGASIQFVPSGPDDPYTQIKNGFLKLITAAEKNIFIQTPYFVPENTLIDALRVASLSGIDVRIMIPDKSDHPFVHSATLSFAEDLLDAGVKIYAYHNGFLHAKLILIDGQAFTLGSANMDVRSSKLNFEGNAFIYDREAAEKMTEIFQRDTALSSQLTQEFFDQRSITTRIRHRFARLLGPLL
ncbi:cardiolipin synthase [Indiicoccus explosivorum]|uniref:cardiolipin synthase n=1 Tax=Indiicoccus explosivorum TaxID=1917864 RepID=UPI001F4F0717|nr:cardiolipin synthase [Indiicoccus explosivorum]